VYNLSLFGDPPSPEGDTFDRARLARKLADLAKRGVWIGTSSWKYEGWLGQIYTRQRYSTRGRFSEKRFQQECLGEYAETFPIVCGDFSFYQFPTPEFWQRLFTSAGPDLRFALKVPEEITCCIFPEHARYGERGGQTNMSFLDATLFERMFLDALAPYRERVAVLIFEFGTFPRRAFESARQFAAVLDPFLALLPRTFRYAVEIRNQEFLDPVYFDCLARHGVAHVFNAWTRMPEIGRQVQMPETFTADFTVVRALLRRGRPYEDAVARFSPYSSIQDPNPETRAALKELIARSEEDRKPLYVFVNNRIEGNAPRTIQAVVEEQ
jgi:uncharacterized protein YecE (DUF72 family)